VPHWFQRVVLPRTWLVFALLVASFLAFGYGTLNLFFLLQANLELIAVHGRMAVWDGALMQLLEIIVTSVVSMAAYVVFKACENRMVYWLVYKEPPTP
jgi:uncharacterized membrane protein